MAGAALGQGVGLSYSAGVAMRLHDTDTIEAMLQRADVALYQAKSQGRGRTLAGEQSDSAQAVVDSERMAGP